MFTEEQWEKIEKYLPKRKTGRPYKNLRATVNGIYWIMKTGSTWRTLPTCFEDIFKSVINAADTGEISVGSTVVKVHRHALSGLKKGSV